MYTVYILHSRTLQVYYIGYTSMVMENRLSRHLSNHSGFTSKANDWIVIHTEAFAMKRDAIIKEKQIKKRNAKNYLQDIGKF